MNPKVLREGSQPEIGKLYRKDYKILQAGLKMYQRSPPEIEIVEFLEAGLWLRTISVQVYIVLMYTILYSIKYAILLVFNPHPGISRRFSSVVGIHICTSICSFRIRKGFNVKFRFEKYVPIIELFVLFRVYLLINTPNIRTQHFSLFIKFYACPKGEIC